MGLGGRRPYDSVEALSTLLCRLISSNRNVAHMFTKK